MKIQIRYFATLRETIGAASESIETACDNVRCLREHLIARGGAHAQALAWDRPVRVAVNQVMGDDATPLAGDCEVAFFPPVTGG